MFAYRWVYYFLLPLVIYIFDACKFAYAETIPVGDAEQRIQINDVSFQIFTYKPSCPVKEILVVFHGVNRNADEYRNNARSIADTHCMIIVAPVFEKSIFPKSRYQFGGVFRQGKKLPSSVWSVNYVDLIVEWVRKEENSNLPFSLIGHSAGGQFLSRVAAFTDIKARNIIIANPSTYVWPALTDNAPFGLGKLYPKSQKEKILARYLKAPVIIVLGEKDTGSSGRDDSPKAIRQGQTRYERGRAVFSAAQKISQEKKYILNWKLITLEGVGHSSKMVFQSPEVVNALR